MAKTDWKNSDIVKPDDMNQIGQEINHLHTEFNDRLDMIKTSDITLQPGVQVIQAAKDARFRLGEVRGKTLVSPSPDLLGGKGNFETNDDLAPFFNTPKVRRVETGGVDNSKCLEIELEGTAGSGGLSRAIQVASGKYYVAVAMIRNVTTAQCAIGIQGVQGAFVTSKEYTPAFLRFTKTQVVTGESTRVGLMAQGAAGNTARMDNLRVYEISKAEYDALATMTAEQVSEKYPFGLIGIRGVDGPYTINTTDNLLPPFHEWEIHVNSEIESPYKITLNAPAEFMTNVCRLPLPVGKAFTFSGEFSGDIGGYVHIRAFDSSGALMSSLNIVTNQQQTGTNLLTFTVPVGAQYVEVIFTSLKAGVFTLENPMLTIGSEPKPFRPQRKSMLAFQTEMHANPVDGSDPDVLFEQNGQYSKLVKWKKLVLDGSFSYEYADYDNPGFKGIRFPHNSKPIERSSIGTKYDGKLLTEYLGVKAADKITIDGLYVYIWISNADSGWGESSESDTFSGDGSTRSFTLKTANSVIPNTVKATIEGVTTTGFTIDYNTITFTTAPAAGKSIVVSYVAAYFPTPDEIKAYFLGWKMYIWGSSDKLYNGIGEKGWGKIYRGIGAPDGNGMIIASGVNTLPTELNDQGYTPYQILYRLAKTVVEPVVSEGALLLSEGDNMIEIGRGIVLRESAKPTHYSTNGNYYINNTAVSGSLLKNRVSRILRVYRNDRVDNSAKIENDVNAYGKQHVRFLPSDFDPTSAYSVTYLKLEKSLVVPITGTLASNEKAQISDLTAGVAEALQRVSVVEQKKADEDAPGWIAPTLLNGWKSVVSFRYRVTGGYVEFAGSIEGGPTGPGIQFFKLIPTARPKIGVQASVAAFNGTGWQIGVISCSPDGIFYIDVPTNNKVVFDGVRISLY